MKIYTGKLTHEKLDEECMHCLYYDWRTFFHNEEEKIIHNELSAKEFTEYSEILELVTLNDMRELELYYVSFNLNSLKN